MKRKLVITISIVSAVIIALVLVYFLHPHKYNVINHSDATCTIPENTEYKCWCGASYIEEGDVIPHDYIIKETIEATTDAEGSIIYSCAKCGDEYTEQTPKIDKASGLFEDASAEQQDSEIPDAEEIIEPETTPVPDTTSSDDTIYKKYVTDEQLDVVTRFWGGMDYLNNWLRDYESEGATAAEIKEQVVYCYESQLELENGYKDEELERLSKELEEAHDEIFKPQKSSTSTQSTPPVDTSNQQSTRPVDDSTVGNYHGTIGELNVY